MLSKQSFDEIRVYEGVAERTGVQFERSTVRRSVAYCRSMSELARKVRRSGDGCFYLPLESWPAESERVDLQKQWVVLSSLPRAER